MKRAHWHGSWAVMLGWVLWVSACGGGASAPAGPSPSAAAVAAPSASAPAATAPGAAVVTVTPAPSATDAPVADIRAFIDQVSAGPHDTVKSADGSVELLIPNGALPAGKTVGDISIKPMSAAQAGVTLDGQPPLSAYQMEPDGLQFTAPVLLSITQTASSGGNVPVLFTLSGEQASPLSPIVADVNVPSGKLVAMAAMHHFSTLILGVPGAVHLALSLPGSQLVKVPFSADAVSSLEKGIALSGGTWRLGGRFSAGFELVPDNAVNPEFPTTVTSNTYKASQQFTCTERGIPIISYVATFEFDELISVAHRNAITEAILHTEEKVEDENELQCLEPTLTPTPSGEAQRPPDKPKLNVAVPMGVGRDALDTYGEAMLSPDGDQTQVNLQLKAGSGPNLPAFIQQGRCPNPGTPKYPLNPVLNGQSNTVINASLASLLSGGFAINVQKPADQPNAYVSCGDIAKGVVIPLGPGRDGDQTPGTLALIDRGAQTQLSVGMKPQGFDVLQPLNVYAGSCSNLGSVKYMVGIVHGGTGYGNISAPLSDLLKGGLAVSVQKSAAEPGVSVACADLK